VVACLSVCLSSEQVSLYTRVQSRLREEEMMCQRSAVDVECSMAIWNPDSVQDLVKTKSFFRKHQTLSQVVFVPS
jgi:hypothetical protein